jgi:hypothetical protein
LLKTGAGWNDVERDVNLSSSSCVYPFGWLWRQAGSADPLLVGWLKSAYDSPPNRLMLLSSARAIPEAPAASAAATTRLFTIENLLFMTAPCPSEEWMLGEA